MAFQQLRDNIRNPQCGKYHVFQVGSYLFQSSSHPELLLRQDALFVNLLVESVQNWKFCKMSLFLARSRFEYCAIRASPKKLARHWSLGPSLEMSPKFGKLASTSPCKWSIFKLIHYFFPFPCFIYLHLIQFYVRLNKITFLYVWIIENIRSKAL